MPNIYYWEKLTFSNFDFLSLKSLYQVSFRGAPTLALNFETSVLFSLVQARCKKFATPFFVGTLNKSLVQYSKKFRHNWTFYYDKTLLRSSRPEMFCKKGVLRNFAKFSGKYLCLSLFFNKVTGLKPANLLKKRLWHRCFPMNFMKF